MNIFRNFKTLLAAVLVWGLSSAVSVYAVSLGSGFSPSTVNPGDYSILSMYVFNDSNAQLTSVGWTNNLPADMTIQSSPAITTDCGGTLTATPGTSTMSLTGGTVAPQSQCTVSVPVRSSLPPNSVSVNAVPALTLTSSPYYTNSAFEATLTINIFAAPTLSTSLDHSLIYLGETANLTISVINTDVTKTLTQTGWAHTLPTGLQVNGVATDNGNCGTPAITATTGTTAIALSAATIAPNASCTITIPITGNAQGNYSIDLPVGAITSYQNATNASPSSQSIAVQSFSASKAFNPASVKTNQVSTMSISITSKAPYSNLAFTDDFSLQTGLVVAPTPNAVVTGVGCSGTVTANPGSQVVSLSNGVIPAGGTFLAPKVCTVSVDVVVPSGLNIGTKTNTLAIGAIASGTASNINVASAALSVTGYTAPTLSKTLSTATSFVGQVISLAIRVKNNDATTFTNVGWVDDLPAGMIVTGAAAFSGCTGTPVVTTTLSNTRITLSGASIVSNATCIATIPVTAVQQGTNFVNTMPIGIVTNDQGTSNTAAASVTLTTVSAFTVVQKLGGISSPATMSTNTATKLRIEITNKSTDSYHNLSFSDSFVAGGSNLPVTFTVINPGNAVTTCNATGTPSTTGVTTTASTVALSGGVLAAGSAGNATPTCYVEVDVQATAAITSKINVILGGVTALADGTGILTGGLDTPANATVANLTISASALAAPTISTKTFTPNSIVVGSGSTQLKISVKNNDGATTLTNVTWTDTFPTGMVWTGGAITYTNCGTGSVTFDVTNSIATLGGGVSLAPGGICDAFIPVKATSQGLLVNNIPIGNIGNDQNKSNAVAKAANLTSTSLTAGKVFRNALDTGNVTDMNVGDTFKLKITITNPSLTESYNSLSFTDDFANYVATVGGAPALQIATIPNALTTCGAGVVTTGAQSVSLTGGTLAANSSCYVLVNVTALAAMASTANTIVAGTLAGVAGEINALSDSNGSKAWKGATTTTNLIISTIAPPTFSAKNFSPNSVFMGQYSTLTISVKNNDATATLNNVTWTDTFPWGLVVVGSPSKSTGCYFGKAAASAIFAPVAGDASLNFSGGTIGPNATCTVTVRVTGTSSAGSYPNSIGIGAITTTEGVTNAVASPAPALWLEGLQMTKSFSVSPVAIGAVTQLAINVTNNTTVAFSGINVTDDFSTQTGMVIANPPNIINTGGVGCTPGTVNATAGGNVVTLSGFALAAGTSAAQKICTVRVDVVGNVSGAKTNTIPELGITATPASLWTAPATASLVVGAATLTVAKTFTVNPANVAGTILADGADVALMRITITNPNSVSVNSLNFTDTFPASMTGLVVSSATTPVNTCGGTLTAAAGTNVVGLVGAVTDTLAVGGSCYIEVSVVSTTAFMNRTNSVAVTAKTSLTENITAVTGTANLTANALSVAKSFSSGTVVTGGKTRLTITIVNHTAAPQTALAFTDTFPLNLGVGYILVDTIPNVSTTCGSVTAVAGANSVALSGGTLAANASCSVSVDVVGNLVTGVPKTNNVSITSSQQTTAVSASANFSVIDPSVLITPSKSFSPTTITLLQNSTATISWVSSSVGDTVNPIVTDNLPVGLTVAAVPNVTASCTAPVATPVIASTTVSPTRNQIVVALTMNQVPNQNCSITFDVTPTQPGTLTNTLAKGDILSSDGAAANTVTASADLTVTNVLTIGKTFQPTDLSFSGVAMLTITVTNPEAIPLTGASLRDNLPATTPNDLIVAGAPYTTAVATTDCTADGSQSTALVTAVAGTRIIQLTGGVIPSKQGAVDGVCHITVPVKLGSASPTGPATNTIPIGTGVVGTGLTSTEGRFNINAASATINFVAPTLGIGKAFSPASVTGGSVSRLTVTINNQNNFIQTGLAFTDNMPTGMTVGAPADPQTTCTGGTFTGAATGSASWSFSGGVVAASGSCTVSLNVTMNVRNVLTNTIPVNALTSANGGKNTLQGAANLNNLAGVSIAKAFTPNPAVVNQPIRLTFTITNASDTPLTQLGFVDDLTLGGTQTGLTVSPTPNVSGNCGGGTVVASGTSITLSNGFLGVDSACSILVDVMTDTARSYVNTVPIHAITSLEGKTNAAAGTDTLPVYVGIRAVKQLSPTSDAGRFVLTLSPAAPSGVSSRTNVGHDATPSAVASFFATEGTTYTVTETGQGATSLANYLTTWACRNADNTLLASGSGAAATVTAPTTAGGATKNQQDISCTFTNVNKIALVTVNSVSNGGVGSFTFTGTNGLPISATTITTTTAGVSATTAALTEVVLSSKGVATVITDGALSGGFVLSGASCTGLQGGDTATLVGSVLTIPSTSIVDGARISCTFTHLLPSAKTLTLRKQWVGATLNDAVNITATGLTPLASIATTAGKLDTGTAQSVSNGAVITIAEAFSVGSAANYTATLACTGTTGLSGNVLTVGVADGAIVCTQTNTFTGAGGSSITGTVFKDTGAGGGTANNGVQDGAELGIAGVTITANQASCASTVCGTAITDGAGNYTLVLPSTVTGVITLTETNLNGMLSTGGSAGTSAGTYTRSTDTVTAFNVVAGTTYTGLSFGDVPDNQFVTDGVQTAFPGSIVFYPHYFVAGTAGSVAFSYTKSSSPALTGWSELIYVDANCDGVIGAADVLVAASVALTADQKVCLLVKQFVPANVPVNAQNALTLTALFTSTFANPTAGVSFSYVRHDTTTVGQPTAAGLSLVKQVNTPTASPGTNIVYTVVYTNSSTGPLSNVVIHDATPAYTTFQSAGCGTLPLNFTVCSITNPAVGASGSIIYTFTGTLAPAASGAVTFTVQVQP
ncbi:MAG: hypothetical protein WAO71_08305 [Gallionella sp.]